MFENIERTGEIATRNYRVSATNNRYFPATRLTSTNAANRWPYAEVHEHRKLGTRDCSRPDLNFQSDAREFRFTLNMFFTVKSLLDAKREQRAVYMSTEEYRSI